MELKLEEKTRAKQVFIEVTYNGGDADGEHIDYFKVKDCPFFCPKTFQPTQTLLDKIEFFKKAESVIDQYKYDMYDAYEKIKEEHGEELADFFDNVPNDPMCDYQHKMYIDRIKVVAYDSIGNKYSSWV